MKKVVSFYLLLLLMSFQCDDQNPGKIVTECIDPSKIKEGAPCIMIYDPVCGCDGKTYGNSCIAGNAGLKSWEKGECGE